MIDARAVDDAAERLAGVAACTPLQLNERLSAATGAYIWLKREDLQPVRSYKIRGAYNLISQLDERQRAAGVICASAGNHGQGVAFACARLGIRARIFVPATTPRQKRERMVALGEGRVELAVVGDSYDDAAAGALLEASVTGATVVPAFDDPELSPAREPWPARSSNNSAQRPTCWSPRSAEGGCSPAA